ncbi:uncharacterized protein LOC143594228 [Bidens hawaiensis]|uniref:uncharacterized protein LOC143594228 n=1 Tax=Bidens hawaiensis TaxID=980011 RepID=UPI004049525C
MGEGRTTQILDHESEKVKCLYKDFSSCNPNPFLGAANPIESQRWITEIKGMDWLSRHHPKILCHQKIIHLSAPSGRQISTYGEKEGNLSICSIMKAKKYLNHGYKAFLAYVVDTSQVEIEIENVPIVNEFSDVFPDDLPGKVNAAADALRRKEGHQSTQTKYLKMATRYGRVWIPNTCDVKILLLDEAHKSKYSIHSGATKMYHDLCVDYWCLGMKRDIVKYVEKCLTCLQVKAEHQKPYGKIQQLEIPKWKWEYEYITMDLVTKLPKTSKVFDAIWVIVDRLTKGAHFLPKQESYSSEHMAKGIYEGSGATTWGASVDHVR